VKALETSPEFAIHLRRLAAAYRAAGRAQEAETALIRVMEMDQKSGDEQKIATDGDGLGSLYLSQKRFARPERCINSRSAFA